VPSDSGRSFRRRETFPPESSRDRRKPTLILETLDGTVEFSRSGLSAQADEINRAASELWPSWKKPGRLLRKDRRNWRT
jgi:hypothetical protein